MSDDRTNARVGAGVLVLLGLAVALVLGVQGRHLRPGITLHVEMERVGPLQAGHSLRVAGRTIGSVDRVRLLPAAPGSDEGARVVLDVWIERRSAWMIRRNSELFVSSVGLLGEPYLEAGAPRGEPGPPIADGDTVRGVDPPRLDRLMQKSYENLVAVTDLFEHGIPEARALGRELSALGENLDAIDARVAEDAPTPPAPMWPRIQALIDELAAAADGIDDAGVSRERLDASLVSAQRTLTRAQRDLASLRDRIDRLVTRLESVATRLDPERLGRLDEVLRRADAIAARLEGVIAKGEELIAFVRAGRGTLGSFLGDDEIGDEIKRMTKRMKEQPWRAVGNRRNRDEKIIAP